MEKIAFTDAVSETLLINLYFRSRENKEPDPILKDEFSGEIVNKIDYDFSKFDRSKLSRVGVAIRARFFDDWIVKFTRTHPSAVIVQLGAGLDTRPLRLAPLCPEATFYDLDLPDVIALRDKNEYTQTRHAKIYERGGKNQDGYRGRGRGRGVG